VPFRYAQINEKILLPDKFFIKRDNGTELRYNRFIYKYLK